MPEWHRGVFKDKRVELRYEDGRKFLENSKESFDVIIIDIPEPIEEGPAYLLYTVEFYRKVQEKLSENGIIALQSGSSAEKELRCLAAIYRTLKRVFPTVYSWTSNIPSFDIPWSFTMASKQLDPKLLRREEVDRILRERNISGLRYYDGETHEGIFFLPKFIREGLLKTNLIIEDSKPLTYKLLGEGPANT